MSELNSGMVLGGTTELIQWRMTVSELNSGMVLGGTTELIQWRMTVSELNSGMVLGGLYNWVGQNDQLIYR